MKKRHAIIAMGLGVLLSGTSHSIPNCQPTIEAKSVSESITLSTETITVETDKQKIKNNLKEKEKKRAKELKNKLKKIEELKSTDRKKYITKYKKISEEYSDIYDRGETIYDVTTSSEFDLLAGIVQAEIGIGDFNAKCNVASAIINRYNSDAFPDTFKGVVTQREKGMYQFETYANGTYKNKVTEDTILAIEYAYEIEDTVYGCTYFHSGRSSWHETDLKFVTKDKWHKFYTVK